MHIKNWCLAAVILIYIVVMLGAYTRLKDAGLGCPDWPGCYGAVLAPSSGSTFDTIAVNKAWIEMIHRYVAGALGLLILAITIKTILVRRSNPRLWITATIILCLVIMQALLGMWTVTLRLYPIVVMAHLLGGFAILALTWLLYLQAANTKRVSYDKYLFYLGCLCLVVLITQIALGGWTSANYAALVCADFPTCQGQWWPAMDWRSAFNFKAVGIFDSPGVPLENSARVTIQMLHRIGALVTTILFCSLSFYLYKSRKSKLKRLSLMLLATLSLQLVLGISNVLARLPIAISLLHNVVAALLLLLTITILFNLNAKSHKN